MEILKNMPVEGKKTTSNVTSEENLKHMTWKQKMKQWYDGDLYNRVTLNFKNPKHNEQYRALKYEHMFWPLVLNCVIDGCFSIYRIYLTSMRAQDWNTPKKPETQEEFEFRDF